MPVKRKLGREEMKRLCFFCGTEMEERLISTSAGWGDYNTSVDGIKAYVCTECGEVVYSADEIHRLQEIGKKLAEESGDDK
jgi:YgiT-type zinc finger domain-containing protein